MNKLIFLMLGVLILGSLMVSAGTDTVSVSSVFDWNEEINYIRSCNDNNTLCNINTNCNMTVQYPDKLVVFNNSMTNLNNGYYKADIPKKDNNQTGIYTADMYCVTPDGRKGAETSYFQVTPGGINESWIIYVLILAIIFGLLLLGFKLEDPWIVILGSFVLVFFGLYTLFYGLAGFKDNIYTWAISLILIMTGGYIGIRSSLETIGT